MPSAYGVDGGDTVEQSGFARARSAHNTDILTTLYLEADVVERLCNSALAAVIFFDMFYSKQGCRMIWVFVHGRCSSLVPFLGLVRFLSYIQKGRDGIEVL